MKATKKSINNGEAVWTGIDYGKYTTSKEGFLDVDGFDFFWVLTGSEAFFAEGFLDEEGFDFFSSGWSWSCSWLWSCFWCSFKIFSAYSLLISFLDGFALVLIRSIIFSSYTVPLKLANADGFFW